MKLIFNEGIKEITVEDLHHLEKDKYGEKCSNRKSWQRP
jgi:hypothetical protein